ncbi:helix-turn-helix transcriptional regulator [Rhodocytophaga rosea]|uniref:Helix-turn-helix transcriptional regulator n=1 Tax=Rhodocytophaga rosea TaxID=2704465 RepID=A0A6C0GKS4_9BACT|nr:helix-turn-helix domain-containing protein [Rhodocytophaga rosea]QHT68605.1 helix-turn-helix transcriptional regulator [Rhodocytophaga rosea]
MEKTVKIKGMVCRRCIEIVKEIFESQGLPVHEVKLGEVTYQENDAQALEAAIRLLEKEGFELLTDKQSLTIAKVKELVEQELNTTKAHSRNFAQLLTESLPMDYDTISALFSHTEGITLEQYLIHRRVQKVQQLLKYTSLTLTDIAFDLGYSSVHHLSNQFKKITGMSPSQFRELQAGVEK